MVKIKVWQKEICEHCGFKTNKNWSRLKTGVREDDIRLLDTADIDNGILPEFHDLTMGYTSIPIDTEHKIEQELFECTDLFLIKMCNNCFKLSIFNPISNDVIYPFTNQNISPNKDLPEDIKKIYIESSQVLNASPRAAMALLRLALDKIVNTFLNDEQKKKALGKKIDIMFSQFNIPEEIKDIAHSIRGIGNESVHPGTISDEIDIEEVLLVFDLINIIADVTITKRKKTENFISKYRHR